jgi:hypothetical protein
MSQGPGCQPSEHSRDGAVGDRLVEHHLAARLFPPLQAEFLVENSHENAENGIAVGIEDGPFGIKVNDLLEAIGVVYVQPCAR